MLDYTRLKLISNGNTAEIFAIDDTKILKLYREGLPLFLREREFEYTRIAREILKNVPTVYEIVNCSN